MFGSRIDRLLSILNKYSKNSDYPDISSLDELIKVIEQSREFYMSYYMEYLKSGREEKSIKEIILPFLELETFISQYKRALNNNSYFGIIIDKKEDYSISSIKAVNTLVGSRINKDISMKVAVEPDKWDIYVDSCNRYVEAVHDYGIVELDDSHTEYVRRLKKYNKI